MTELPAIKSNVVTDSGMYTYFHDEHRLVAEYVSLDDKLVPRHFEMFYGNRQKAHFNVDVNGDINFTWNEPGYTAESIRPFLASVRAYNAKLDVSHLPAD